MSFSLVKRLPPRFQAYVVLIAGTFLVSDGAVFASSAAITYLYSYWNSKGHNVKPDILGWIFTGRMLVVCCLSSLAGTIERKIGSRVTA